ncbi:hypothetical protein Pelo_5245 [Pelomyxa schiedti]|nr:hypothetical protein Pelo_5245 [Pelomyxa schiedti]
MSPVSAHVFCSHKFFHSPGNDDPLVVTLPEDNTVILFAWALCLEVDESLHMLAGSSVPLVVDVACDASEENCVVKSHREPLPGTQRHDSIMQMFPESVAREVLRGRPTEVTQADVLEKARSFFSQEANPRPEL